MGSWWQPSFNRLEVRDKLCCSWRTRLSPQSCMKRFKCPPEFPIGMKGDLAHGKHFCVVVGTHIRVSIRIGYHGYPILSPSPDQSSSSLLTFEFSRVYAIFRHTHVESPYLLLRSTLLLMLWVTGWYSPTRWSHHGMEKRISLSLFDVKKCGPQKAKNCIVHCSSSFYIIFPVKICRPSEQYCSC